MGRAVGAALVFVCAGLGGSADADVLYGTYRTGYGQSSLVTIDTQTGFLSQVGGIGYDVRSLAYNPADHQLYGADAYHLYRISTATGQGTVVGAFRLDGSSAEPYPGGTGSGYESSSEASYPTASGSGSSTETSAEPNYDHVDGAVTSISFDSYGTLYALRNTGTLYSVDPSSARADSMTYLGTGYAGRLGIWGAGDNAVVYDATLTMTAIALPGDSGSSALPTVATWLTAPYPNSITRVLGMTTNHDAQAVRQDYGSSSELSSETGSDAASSSETGSSVTPLPTYSSETGSSATPLPAYSSETGSSVTPLPAYSSEVSSESTGSGSTALPSNPATPSVGPGGLWGLFNLYNPYVYGDRRGIGVIDPVTGSVSNLVTTTDGTGGYVYVNAVAFAPAAVVPNPAAAAGGIVLAGGYVATRAWRGRRQRRGHGQ